VKRLIVMPLLVAALFGGGNTPASAASGQANCTGAFASTFAGPGFGPFVSGSARFFNYTGTSLGAVIGNASSTNDCSAYPTNPYGP
jgi:hypothetical protein